jgi:hypothetical protein
MPNPSPSVVKRDSLVTLKVPIAMQTTMTLKANLTTCPAMPKKTNGAINLKGQPDVQFTRPFKDCVDITGQRQSGKTKFLTRELLPKTPQPIEIFDTMGIISEAIRKGELTLRPHQHIFTPHWSQDTLPDLKGRLAVFIPWCQMVWRRGNCIAVIEEWHLFCNGKYVLPAAFANLFNQGGNRNIALWGTSQAPAQCHNDMLRACSHHFIFSLWMPQDLRFMADFIPARYVTSKDPDAQTIETLQPYHFFYYNTQTKQADFFNPITL